MNNDTLRRNKQMEPSKQSNKPETLKDSSSDKIFEEEFKALIANLHTKEKSRNQCCSLITEFISNWSLKENQIYQTLQDSKYPEDTLKPSLFEKLMVFNLKKIVEDKCLERTHLKDCLDAIDDVLTILDQLFSSSFSLKVSRISEEECLYYYLMTNFLSLSREDRCLNRIYTLKSYFELDEETKRDYVSLQDLSKDSIMCDVTSKLKQIFQNLISNRVDLGLYYQGSMFVFSKENMQIEKSYKISYEMFTDLLELIPTYCLLFSRIYITGLYSINLYNGVIGLDRQLLEKHEDPDSVIKARCLLILLSEVARIWQIKTFSDHSYFQPILGDALLEEKEYEQEDKETDNDEDNSKKGDNKDQKRENGEESKMEIGEEADLRAPKTNEGIYFLERAFYGGEVNLRKIKVHQAEMILNEQNYCSLQSLNNLKETMVSAVEEVWNVKGLRIGRVDKDPHRKCGNHRK